MTLAEVNDPPVLREVLRDLDIQHGPGVAKTCRSALKGMFDWAVTRRALAVNEIGNVEPWKASDQEGAATAEAKKKARNGKEPIARDHDRATDQGGSWGTTGVG